MAYEFRLPDIGEGLHEAEVLQWFVKVGEDIQADQPVVEVQTDKAAVEIASPVGGRVVSLGGQVGETIKVGDVLIAVDTLSQTMASADQGASAHQTRLETATSTMALEPQKTVANPDAAPAPAQAGPARKALAAPAVRKLAHDLGVQLNSIVPSDPSGRVTRADVERAAKLLVQHSESASLPAPAASTGPAGDSSPGSQALTGPATQQASAAPMQAQAPAQVAPVQPQAPAPFADQAANPAPAASPTPVPAPTQVSPQPLSTSGQAQAAASDRREPIRGLRKRIYQNMAKSMYTAPQTTGMDDLDATRLVELRQRLLPFAEARGIKLTYLPIVIKAVTHVLLEYPIFNASVDDDAMEVVYKGAVNIGIATATSDGLLVPVIRDADKKSVFEIARELEDLTARGRERKLELPELTGSTFTITSTGANGGWFATPIINHPEVAILGVHSIAKRAVVLDDDSIVAQQRMSFSLTFDHRIIDGEPAGRFMVRFKEYLENPELLLAL